MKKAEINFPENLRKKLENLKKENALFESALFKIKKADFVKHSEERKIQEEKERGEEIKNITKKLENL